MIQTEFALRDPKGGAVVRFEQRDGDRSKVWVKMNSQETVDGWECLPALEARYVWRWLRSVGFERWHR